MTLEQSVNRDAASKFTGITAFTTNASGRLRWSLTKSAKARTVTLLTETAGLNDKDGTAQVFELLIIILFQLTRSYGIL